MRRLLFILPLLTLALMAGFFAWSLTSGRNPASIGSVMVGRPAPRIDLPALRPGERAARSIVRSEGACSYAHCQNAREMSDQRSA